MPLPQISQADVKQKFDKPPSRTTKQKNISVSLKLERKWCWLVEYAHMTCKNNRWAHNILIFFKNFSFNLNLNETSKAGYSWTQKMWTSNLRISHALLRTFSKFRNFDRQFHFLSIRYWTGFDLHFNIISNDLCTYKYIQIFSSENKILSLKILMTV